MYADFAFYSSPYGGSLILEEEFAALERQAELHVDLLTFNRLREGHAVTDRVKMAVCAVADVAKNNQAVRETLATAAKFKSENVEGYSVSYQDTAAIKASLDQSMSDAAYPYLIYTGLMDRVAGRCCQ